MRDSAPNYSAKAMPALQFWAEQSRAAMPMLSAAVDAAIEALDTGVHFIMPDDGFVIPGKSMDCRKLLFGGRLPFPVCVCEFSMSGRLPTYESAPYTARRRLVIAMDLSDATARQKASMRFPGAAELAKHYDNQAALIWAIDSIEDRALLDEMPAMGKLGSESAWSPGWLAVVAPYDQSGEAPLAGDMRLEPDQGAPIGQSGTAIERTMTATFKGLPVGESGLAVYQERCASGWQPPENFSGEYIAEIGAVLGLIAASQCKNIQVREIHPQPKLQAARARRGKPPLQTYRELILAPDVRAHNNGNQTDALSFRARPAEHLRSGHIRRVNGESIWINWTVVNPGLKTGASKAVRRVLPRA